MIYLTFRYQNLSCLIKYNHLSQEYITTAFEGLLRVPLNVSRMIFIYFKNDFVYHNETTIYTIRNGLLTGELAYYNLRLNQMSSRIFTNPLNSILSYAEEGKK